MTLRIWMDMPRLAASLATLLFVSYLLAPAAGAESPDDHWWDGFGVYAETGLAGSVGELLVYRDSLIAVGGFFDTFQEIRCVAKWEGARWATIGGGVLWDRPPCEDTCFSWINHAVVWQDNLVVGGRFLYAGGRRDAQNRANYIARWDGTRWYPLGAGLNDQAFDLIEYQGDLIVCGLFTQAGGLPIQYVARWNGISWNDMGGGANAVPTRLAVFQGELIAIGAFATPGQPLKYIARWDGQSWIPFGEHRIDLYSELFVYRDRLVAQVDHFIGGVLFPAVSYWDGQTWVPMGDQMDANAFAEYSGDLVAAGAFPANTHRSRNIARWNGTAWQPMGSGVYDDSGSSSSVGTLLAHDGSLYVGGNFTHAGGKPSYYVARWDDIITPVVVEALEASRDAGVVRLAWRLSRESQRDIVGIRVDRAGSRAGPYEERTWEALFPETEMTFLDPAEGERSHWYRLRVAHLDGTTSFAGPIEVTISGRTGSGLRLAAIASPGAGAPVAIRYGLERDYGRVDLQVFTASGRLVRWLDGRGAAAGEHVRYWDRRNDSGIEVSRGVYWVRLEADGQSASRRILLLNR